jgi:hypothetical protein
MLYKNWREYMTFFEQEMRSFLKADTVLHRKIFYDKMVIGTLSPTIVVKISFHNFGYADHYSGLLVQIINKTHGVIDTQSFHFGHILSHQVDGVKKSPHLWENNGKVAWSNSGITDKERNTVMELIQKYMSLYV